MIKRKLIDNRTQKGISQEKMADLLGLNTSNYNRRESGETQIKIKEWEKIASLLEVPISEIFESEEASVYLNAKNNSNGQVVGDNNTIMGIDETTLKNLNDFIKNLKEALVEKDLRIKQLEADLDLQKK
jgi:transcriptional regulator with XRE-family HTH domain